MNPVHKTQSRVEQYAHTQADRVAALGKRDREEEREGIDRRAQEEGDEDGGDGRDGEELISRVQYNRSSPLSSCSCCSFILSPVSFQHHADCLTSSSAEMKVKAGSFLLQVQHMHLSSPRQEERRKALL